jgi:hypothetical protein
LQTSNPLIMLDEIDKIVEDFKGDPLLHYRSARPEQKPALLITLIFLLIFLRFHSDCKCSCTYPLCLRDRMRSLSLRYTG